MNAPGDMPVDMGKIRAQAQLVLGKTDAEFDYSLTQGWQHSDAVREMRNMVWFLVNPDMADSPEEQKHRADEAWDRVRPEVQVMIDQAKAKDYLGWSNASGGPIRYAP